MAASKPVFLDVDPKIIENNLILEECKTNLDGYKALFGMEDDGKAPWKLVTPLPAFCVKTVDGEKNKVFVNLCTLNDIPEPRDVSEDALLELIESQDAADFRVPLSLQEPREELDKSGKPALCYDVAINPKFLRKVEQSAVFKMFLLQVTFDGLKDKFDVDLEIEDYVVLKNRKSMGTLRPHRLRTTCTPYRPPKQLVQEVTSATTQPKPVTKPQQNELDYRLFRTTSNGQELLYGEIHLPGVTWSKDVSLEVGEDRVVVECRRAGHVLDVFLPLSLDPEHARAEFSTTTRILYFATPLLTAT